MWDFAALESDAVRKPDAVTIQGSFRVSINQYLKNE